jgi:hypothetical protein
MLDPNAYYTVQRTNPDGSVEIRSGVPGNIAEQLYIPAGWSVSGQTNYQGVPTIPPPAVPSLPLVPNNIPGSMVPVQNTNQAPPVSQGDPFLGSFGPVTTPAVPAPVGAIVSSLGWVLIGLAVLWLLRR